jgi:branched-chain amino acid transport system permease protein
MTDLLSQILNGLAIGNVYAMLAIGFVLVFGVANLINFAQGSLFVVGGYLTYTFAVLMGLPLALAATIAVALTALLGLVIDRAFLRPLEKGPRIAPLLATLAIAVILDETIHLIWSPDTKPFPSPLARTTWQLGNAYISAVDVLILVVGVGTIVALTLFLNRTWIGRAMRATAMDPEAAQQMGVDVSAMRSLTFAIAGLVGGVGGVLVGFYYQSIWPTMGIPLGIKGFTAALLGGISSIPGAIVGGLLLGVFESLASGYLGSIYRNLIAYGLLLLVLFFRPQGLFGSRGLDALGGAQAAGGAVPSTSLMASPFQTTEPRAFTTPLWLGGLLVAAAASFPLWAPDTTWVHILGLAFVYAILAVSLTIVSGTAGQISVGHAGIWGVGAYIAAIVTTRYAPGLPIELVLLLAGIGGAMAGVLSGFFAARLSGHVIVMATLASGLIFYSIFLVWMPMTRGPMGIFGIPPPSLGILGGMELWQTQQQYWLALAVLAIVLFLASRLLDSDVGRLWRAVREDRLAAVASGVPAVRYLLMAFGVSGFIAGVSGALYAHYVTAISPNSFLILISFQVLAIVVLGGLGNLTGAVFGAVVLIGVTEALRGFGDYRMVTYGVILLAVILFRPRGLFGSR